MTWCIERAGKRVESESNSISACFTIRLSQPIICSRARRMPGAIDSLELSSKISSDHAHDRRWLLLLITKTRYPSAMPTREIAAPAGTMEASGMFTLPNARLFAMLNVAYSASMYMTPNPMLKTHFPLPQ